MLRRTAGVTQSALAEAAGTSQPTVAAYEKGRKSPTLSTVRRLAESVGLASLLLVFAAGRAVLLLLLTLPGLHVVRLLLRVRGRFRLLIPAGRRWLVALEPGAQGDARHQHGPATGSEHGAPAIETSHQRSPIVKFPSRSITLNNAWVPRSPSS
ncbi:MAG: helix-turn-helix transcriptional regulator [Planctomycetota bacterium]|nr:helix-turn-helix transcriptional regulator [Planctomycetota bacterium]